MVNLKLDTATNVEGVYIRPPNRRETGRKSDGYIERERREEKNNSKRPESSTKSMRIRKNTRGRALAQWARKYNQQITRTNKPSYKAKGRKGRSYPDLLINGERAIVSQPS